MRRRRISTHLRTAAIALTLLLAACDAGSSVAATVGEAQITEAQIEEAYAERPEVSESASEARGSETTTVEADLQREVLTNLVRREILRLAAEDQQITVTEEDLAAERDALVEQLGGQEALDELLAANSVSEEQLQEELRDQAIQTKIGEQIREDVPQASVRAAFDEDPLNRYGPTIEVRHILTETPAEAQDAIARITGGEDFATVARDVSTDPASASDGGELGAITPGQTLPAFEEAAFAADEGEIVGPVETEFGFHVVEVTDRTPAASFADVEDDIRARLEDGAAGRAFSDYLAGFVDELTVEIDDQYGRWDQGSISVVSTARPDTPQFPAQPPEPTTLSP